MDQGLKPQEFVASQFWKLEAHDEGVSRVGFSCSLSPWFADGPALTMSSHDISFVYVLPWGPPVHPNFLLFFLNKDMSHIGLWPTLLASF